MLKINDNVTITVGGERLEVVGSEFVPIDIPQREKVAFIVSREKFDLYAAAPELLDALERAEYLYSSNALMCNDVECGKWINTVREVINKAKGLNK